MRNARAVVVLGVMVGGGVIATAQSQAPSSPAAARELVQALEAQHAEAIAAADPMEAGSFVAALYIPGSQLLVVSARHPTVDGLAQRLTLHQFRDVYLDLQATPTPEHKFFVQDAGADGLQDGGKGGVDVLYENGVRQTLFNGNPGAQKLTGDEYRARLTAADTRYARVLALLTAAVRTAAPPPTSGVPPAGGRS